MHRPQRAAKKGKAIVPQLKPAAHRIRDYDQLEVAASEIDRKISKYYKIVSIKDVVEVVRI